MKRVLILSDPHLLPPGERIVGLDPAARFSEALAFARARQPHVDHLILLGDLTHHGTVAEYEALKALLPTDIPVTMTLGNHDRRDGFATVFEDGAFQNHALAIGGLTILILDTLEEAGPILHAGLICAEREKWLIDQLARAPGPVVVLSHHPFGSVGIGGMDKIALRNGVHIASLFRASGKVQLCVHGHVHRSIVGAWGNLAYAVLPSTCHQAPMQVGETATSESTTEPGGYGLLAIDQGQARLLIDTVTGPPPLVDHDAHSA